MTSEEIVAFYLDMLDVIATCGINDFKRGLDKNKDKLSISELTIASSIITVFDILEKKEKN